MLDIRDVRAEDLPVVRSLLTETWHATYDHIYGVDRVRSLSANWHSLSALAAQMNQPDAAFLVATRDGTIVATSSARRDGPGRISVGRLYVLPEFQGRGIGRALLAATIAAFGSVQLVEIEVEAQNEPAIAFYERQGFSLQRSMRFDGRDDTPNTLLMAKLLGM